MGSPDSMERGSAHDRQDADDRIRSCRDDARAVSDRHEHLLEGVAEIMEKAKHAPEDGAALAQLGEELFALIEMARRDLQTAERYARVLRLVRDIAPNGGQLQ